MASVCIVGAGSAGLITAKTLLDDGFEVHVLTRDRSPGGIWAEERVYPGLSLNNYPQLVDDLLEDMGLPIMRGGGNWLTWPFKVIDLREIEHLHDERLAKRRVSDVDQGRSFTKSALNER
ncbi:hypothetical protein DFH11DRAFT_1728943 [Phellopilus nigrolimitatus]|nr:hypothetical protein DFH11DRAFT_1728943 [Phellopilus nigrolimitatus]